MWYFIRIYFYNQINIEMGILDQDECLNKNQCDHNCTNTMGSFTCLCMPRYTLNNFTQKCGKYSIYFL